MINGFDLLHHGREADSDFQFKSNKNPQIFVNF